MKVLVLGAGKVGFGIASYLINNGEDVTIIEKSAEVAAKVRSISNINVIVGDAINTEILKEANAEIASHVIAVMSNDEQNIVACKFAGSLFNVKTKIARIKSTAFLQKNIFELFFKENFAIDIIIQPEIEVANAVCDIAQICGAFDVMNGENSVIVGLKCLPDTEVINTTFKHFKGVTDLDVFVLTITRNNVTFFPHKDDLLLPEDEVYIATTAAHLNDTLKLFGHNQSKKQNILIVGGGELSVFIMQAISKRNPDFNITMMEESLEKAEKIAEIFPNITSVFGDPLEYNFLREITTEINTAIIATDDEKVNILASLFLKQMGVKRILTLAKSIDYSKLLPLSSECFTINPNAITIEVIAQKSRKGKVTSVMQLKNQFADVVEARVTESCMHVGSPVKSLEIKDEIIPIFAVRSGVTTPAKGDLILCDEDVVVMLVAKKSLKKVEKIFSNYLFSRDDTINNDDNEIDYAADNDDDEINDY
jgi:trk system potassium uptake protein TrkA